MGRTSRLRAILLLLPWMCLWIQSAEAVVVYKRGSNKPITGHLVRQDEREVVIRDEASAGLKEIVIPRAEIEDLIESISVTRLEALDPARPQEYREYAEELAEKKLDPEARLMAVRLFQIAAWLDPANTGHGALLGLVSVARPGVEEARFRAAAYLFDPGHDKALLEKSTVLAPGKQEESPVQGLLEALRLLRRGRGVQARAVVSAPAIGDELAAQQALLSRDEFLAACAAKELSDEQLRKVLDLELSLESRLQGGSELTQTTLASWNDSVRTGNLAPLPQLQFDRLTEFNPRESVFRNGKWQQPDPAIK
jgi:hypothetical protein